jgi:Cdc6-like AAA superfamily ATPase
VLRELDASTKSSLQPITVYFKNYDARQLREILHGRAKHGLIKSNNGSLAQIAAMTTKKTNGDARVAIKTLYYTVTETEAEIGACFEKARKDIIIDMINDLSDPILMILHAVTSTKSDFAKDIYTRYCQISLHQNERPFSYVYFYSNLSYLQSMGLVALIATKVGRTYANRVMLTFDEPILEPIYKLRFGRM